MLFMTMEFRTEDLEDFAWPSTGIDIGYTKCRTWVWMGFGSWLKLNLSRSIHAERFE